jgi:phosphoadenosine phosphosulfate reductase
MNLLGMNKRWNYPQNDDAPVMWAEAEKYIYRGKVVARAKGGCLYSSPTIIYTEEDGIPEGTVLVPVDVHQMVERNKEMIDNLAEDTAKRLYNEAYKKYLNKIDLFYVAFSGGKDSIVALDIAKRTLPHDSFVVVFGDTKMEFSDTYDAVNKVKLQCESEGIKFLIAASDSIPKDAWKKFGPPSTTNRWCCSVFKTAPQILTLREYLQKPDFTGMAIVGVRAEESVARSKYEYISLGEKHKGQYSCNVILDWNSAEIYLYSYSMGLVLNEAYKKGNRRAGCLICPRAADRNDFMNHYWYENESEKLIDIIRWSYKNAFSSSERLEQFINNGGWKARKNGRDLVSEINYYDERASDGSYLIKIHNPRADWKEWIKTIGIIETALGNDYIISFRGKRHRLSLQILDAGYNVYVPAEDVKDVDFITLLKQVFRKSACCVACHECQADCPNGCLSFVNGQVAISDKCLHCSNCHKADKGCLVYKSLERPKGGTSMKKTASLNSYSHFSPKIEWIEQYFYYKNDFRTNHTLGKNMYDFFIPFLHHSGLMDATGFSRTASILDSLGLSNEATWGIMLVNLAHTRQVNWVVTTVPFNTVMTKEELALRMIEDGAKETWTSDVFTSMTRLGDLPFGDIGFGKTTKVKRKAWFERTQWATPISEVVLYSLYKFAEACGNYHQFTLSYLMDESIERDGVSPSTIFGLDRNSMIRIINGLAINYPDYISASFSFDLDTITLRKENKSEDVLVLL